ncbi:ATP-grasp domain-containing protein [bacterium]|nr:ATP-grasp domain-containing protein [bacterium]
MSQPITTGQIKNVHIRYYATACDELGIPYFLDLKTRRLHLKTKNGAAVFCYKASTPLNRQAAVTVSKNKLEVHRLLEPLNIPVPKQIRVKNIQKDLISFFAQNKNIVVKPADSHGGKGVTVLPEVDNLEAAYFRAHRESPIVLAETYVVGENYRFLVLDNEVLAISLRRPPTIIGDGITDIQTLFADLNMENKTQGLPQVPDSEYTWGIITAQGFDKSSILPIGKSIFLRLTANLSLGGTVDDVTETCDQSYKEIAIKVTKVLGLRFAGIDIIAEDLTEPNKAVFVIEANAAPGMRIHYKTEKGAQRNVAKIIMSAIYEL